MSLTLSFRPPLLLLLVALLPAAAGAATPIPSAPQIGASGWLLLDFDSDRVLAEQNADQRLEPASLTKIMTTYVALRELSQGQLKLADEVTVSEKAWRTAGSRMFIEVGKRVTIEELFKGIIIQSGNDASVALAEQIAGSEATFADLMNQHARRLGMTASHFVNSTGLPDDDHYTTPRDIARVSAALIREFPQYYAWFAEREFTYAGIRQHNRNQLLWRDDSVDGVKTGHTEAAGYCLVASARRDGMRLISVVMGTASEQARAVASQALLNYGFRFFETHALYQGGEVLDRLRVWQGAQEQVKVGLEGPLWVTIPRNQYPNMQASLALEPRLVAPIAQGSPVGELVLRLGENEVARAPLIALEENPEGGIWRRLKDKALLWLE